MQLGFKLNDLSHRALSSPLLNIALKILHLAFFYILYLYSIFKYKTN
jgi:hypothetical protein